MARQRRCSEGPHDGDDISHKPAGTKTCSASCRQKRARRLKAADKRRTQKSADTRHNPLGASTKRQVDDVAHELLKEELRPVVREAITDDVMRSLQGMLQLTPRMVELIAADMESPDDTVRQKAYTIVARYTLGNNAITPKEEAGQGQVNVIFGVPRPGTEPAIESSGTEVRECMECNQMRTSFVPGSDRCQDCDDAFKASVKERFSEFTG